MNLRNLSFPKLRSWTQESQHKWDSHGKDSSILFAYQNTAQRVRIPNGSDYKNLYNTCGELQDGAGIEIIQIIQNESHLFQWYILIFYFNGSRPCLKIKHTIESTSGHWCVINHVSLMPSIGQWVLNWDMRKYPRRKWDSSWAAWIIIMWACDGVQGKCYTIPQ